jgi:hypothetical protein
MTLDKIHIRENYDDKYSFCGKASDNFQTKEEVRKNVNHGETHPDHFCKTCWIKWMQWYSFTRKGLDIPESEKL